MLIADPPTTENYLNQSTTGTSFERVWLQSVVQTFWLRLEWSPLGSEYGLDDRWGSDRSTISSETLTLGADRFSAPSRLDLCYGSVCGGVGHHIRAAMLCSSSPTAFA